MYANVFNIFKFELNPLDNKKRYRPLCTFQDISGQFSGHYCNPGSGSFYFLSTVICIIIPGNQYGK
jgi:hypothetical protein